MIPQVIFENKINFKIYGPNIETDEADCEFECEFTDEKEPNSCKLKIYNLNEANMNAVLNNTTYVEIFTNQYGLKDSDGSILWQEAFSGLLRSAIKKPKVTLTKKGKPRKSAKKIKYLSPAITTGDDEADDYIEIDLQEGNGRDIGFFVSKSYRTGFNARKILTDLAKSIDMEIVFDKNVGNPTISFPIILHDNVRNSLTKVASYIGCKAVINGNQVYIVGDKTTGNNIYYQFDESNILQPKYLQDKKIEFVAPYMPQLKVGMFVKIFNKKQEIDGMFQICKIESKFSNHSEECETKVTVKY